MALQKTIDTPFNITFTKGYYRVEEVNISFKENRTTINLFGYKDAETAQLAKTDKSITPINVKIVELQNGMFPFTSDIVNAIKTASYEGIKESGQMPDTIDV